MPTRRLMQFSPTGDGEEWIDDKGKNSTQPLKGVSSTHFLKLIEECGRVGFWTWDFETGSFTTSFGLYRLFGLDPSIPVGREELVRMMHPDDRPAQYDMHETLLAGRAIDREFRIIRPDATMRWLQVKAEVIVDYQGKPVRAIGASIDVTDRYSARQSIETSWRYKLLVEAICAVDMRIKKIGVVDSWDGWTKLTGQTASAAVEWGWLEHVHPDELDLARSTYESAVSSNAPFAVNLRILCKGGSYRRFLARGLPIMGAQGDVLEWFGALIETACFDAPQRSDRDTRAGSVPNGSHVRAARALLDWTVEELAEKSGVSISSISRLESGGKSLREPVLNSVRDAFEKYGVSFRLGADGAIVISHVAGQSADAVSNDLTPGAHENLSTASPLPETPTHKQ